jgi:hypothetical protein
MDQVADPLQRSKEQADAGRRALRTSDGTALLELLEERWGRRLPGKTADQMQANAGAMEVIVMLRRLRERKEG